jgi:ketol-acid reductoisomerase
MASLARSISQTLRVASRRAPCALAKSTQFASYSLLARTVAVKSAQPTAVQVMMII